MEEIYLKARGKINLTLKILDKREDGYYNLESIFQKINLYDELWIKKQSTGFDLESNIQNISIEENIIYKAYILLKKEYPIIKGVYVKLNKKIPMQAGLAGGSTDASSFIIGLNKLYDLKMSKEKMEQIGVLLGADIVPCFYSRPIKAEGIGEIITDTRNGFKYYIVIIKPKFSNNTKEMYEKIDKQKNRVEKQENCTEKMLKALEEKNIKALSTNLYNSFEELIKDNEEIKKAKQLLMQNSAINTLLAGSGSCVFGIFENKEKAKKAYINLKKQYEIYICTSYNLKEKEFWKIKK